MLCVFKNEYFFYFINFNYTVNLFFSIIPESIEIGSEFDTIEKYVY